VSSKYVALPTVGSLLTAVLRTVPVRLTVFPGVMVSEEPTTEVRFGHTMPGIGIFAHVAGEFPPDGHCVLRSTDAAAVWFTPYVQVMVYVVSAEGWA
jgi:hypothetical protein